MVARKTTKKNVTKKRVAKKTTVKKKVAVKRGRPTKYTITISKKICNQLSMGMSLVEITKPSNMPTRMTVYNWLQTPAHEDFLYRYTRARQEQADSNADEINYIADNEALTPLINKKGDIVYINKKPVMVATKESIALAKLRIEARKWTSSKLKPKKYGNNYKHEVELKEKPINEMTDAELEKELEKERKKAR